MRLWWEGTCRHGVGVLIFGPHQDDLFSYDGLYLKLRDLIQSKTNYEIKCNEKGIRKHG